MSEPQNLDVDADERSPLAVGKTLLEPKLAPDHPDSPLPALRLLLPSGAMSDPLPTLDRQLLEELCRRHGIRRLALFGSAASGRLGPNSDVDVLVEFIPGRHVGLRFITVQEELTALLGRRVDLNTPAFLSPHFRVRVQAEAVPLYEAA